MTVKGQFPFGQPVCPVFQTDRTPKKVFVLGVYASAVHARWIGPDQKLRVAALAVASEPEIFWRGNDVDRIIKEIAVPSDVGTLEPASQKLNGPSGCALDKLFLEPLLQKNNAREDTWLCDLVPYSCMNPSQERAIQKKYLPLVQKGLVPKPDWWPVPSELASPTRRTEIEAEVIESQASVIITLGDQPLQWFTKYFGLKDNLSSYGTDVDKYGKLHPIKIGNRERFLLPLVHPRQAAGLGIHSADWLVVHRQWIKRTASELLKSE